MSVTRIAAKAGVSIATVSRVLNNSRPVNPKLADQVHRAMRELQLTPRQIRRRSRSSDRRTTIAIVSLGQAYRAWFEVPVIAGVVAELTRAANGRDLGLLMTEMLDPHILSPDLRRSDVDGALVFVDSSLDPSAIQTIHRQIPVVRVMGGQLAMMDVDHVGPDNNAVGYLAASHLLQLGLRQLAFFTLHAEWDLTRLRAQGFHAAALAAGVNPTMCAAGDHARVLSFLGTGAILHTEPGAVLRQLRAVMPGRFGLFVSRDEETVLVYRLLRELGIEPARDVEIISCDNELIRLSTLHPQPRSIDLGAEQIATQAIRRLLARIEHPDEPPVRILTNPILPRLEPTSPAGDPQ